MHGAHFTGTFPRNEVRARLQSSPLHQHSRRFPQSLFCCRLDHYTLHFISAVRLELEDLAKHLKFSYDYEVKIEDYLSECDKKSMP